MKAFVVSALLGAALIVGGAAAVWPATAPPAAHEAPVPNPDPHIRGVLAIGTGGHVQVLAFIFDDGNVLQIGYKDCLDTQECLAEMKYLISIRHVKIIDIVSDTSV
jgi:hypothetical protein